MILQVIRAEVETYMAVGKVATTSSTVLAWGVACVQGNQGSDATEHLCTLRSFTKCESPSSSAVQSSHGCDMMQSNL